MDAGNSIVNGFEPLIDAVHALSLPPDVRILVAVSGGSDSVALALTLHAVSGEPGANWHLTMGHIHHRLRGTAADEDETFVRALGERLEIPVVVARVDTPAYALKWHMSIEAAARELRYRELRRMESDLSAHLIALGHHMDDQAETVLMNLMRGSALRGLGGMQYASGDLVRPFLGLTRHTITRALESATEPYRRDASNEADDAWRNAVRHRVVPLLQAHQPRLAEVLARTASVVRTDDDYLSDETRAVLSTLEIGRADGAVHAALNSFRHLHPSLQSRVVREMIRLVEGDTLDVEESQVRRLCEELAMVTGPARLHGQLPRRLSVAVSKDRFEISRLKSAAVRRLESGFLPLPGSLTLSVGISPCHYRRRVSDNRYDGAHCRVRAESRLLRR